MKYIIIILIIAVGFLGYEVYKPELKFYPKGDSGIKVPYYTDMSLRTICDFCGEATPLHKVDSRDRIWCSTCYRTKILNR